MISLVFFGSSEYSLIILKKILAEKTEFDLKLIVSKIDKPFGRNQQIKPNPVAQFAKDHSLPLLQLEEFDKNCKLKIENYQAQLGLCVAFGPPFFDEEMINLFPYKIVNIHPSPLPKYRGATPGPWQIINGETKSAVCFFQIDPLPDHGPIISTLPFNISPTETADSFYHKAFSLASEHLVPILKSYLTSHKSSLKEQNHSQKTYFPKLSKEKAQINWTWSPDQIDRFVRALNPWPIAWTNVTNQKQEKIKMKIFSYNLSTNEPKLIQIEGKKPTHWSEIKNYYRLI